MVKLMRQVKGAMTYPVAVISLAVILVNVLLVAVIPVFAEMFASFGAELPKPTQMLIDLSAFLKSYIVYIVLGLGLGFWLLKRFIAGEGREVKNRVLVKLPVVGELTRKVNLSASAVPYHSHALGRTHPRTLEIVAAASNNMLLKPPAKICHATSTRAGRSRAPLRGPLPCGQTHE